MPSAVVLTFTSEGFVIAADGLARDDNGEPISRTTQKIFQAGGLPLGFSLCGRASFDSKNSKNDLNLLNDAPYEVAAISGSKYHDLSSFAFSFGQHLYALLRKRFDAGDMEPLPEKDSDRQADEHHFLHVFLAGYFNGQPDWQFLTFRHRMQELRQPLLRNKPLQKGPLIYGSREVENRLFRSEDPALALYRVKGFQESEHPSLSDGIEAAKNYIRACCDPEIAKFDPKVCAAIGGHIHVAKVTEQNGFEWVVPPKST
jgi:hypothetical protein